MDANTSIYTPGAVLILKVCAVLIFIGLTILAIDRWIVKAGKPDPQRQREARATELGVRAVEDPDIRARLQQRLQAFAELTGEVGTIQHSWLQSQPQAELWLIEFTSNRHSLVQTAAGPRQIEVTRLAILLELHDDPGWPRFVPSEQQPAPPQLPVDGAGRLAAMDDYEMAIDGRWVAFVSKAAFEPLLQVVQANQSAEFHPGLLNSALRIDVQRALDITTALPGAPELARFYAVDVNVRIDTPSVGALGDRLRADRERMATEQAAAREQLRLNMEQQRAEFRQRNEEMLTRFRQRQAELLERTGSGASRSTDHAGAGEDLPDQTGAADPAE